MEDLVKGILEFRQKHLKNYRERFSHLAMGQAPDCLFITCSDSRVVPNLFTTTHPGHLFVLRNAGNIVPPYSVLCSERASIEFAISQLPIETIIVCGHSNCGAMQARLSTPLANLPKSLEYWLSFSKENTELSDANALAKANVLQQLDHLLTYPLIREKADKGLLTLFGWYFDVGTGDLYVYDDKSKQFDLLDETTGPAILKTIAETHHCNECNFHT